MHVHTRKNRRCKCMSEALEEFAAASHFDLWLAAANSAKRAIAQARQKAQSAAVAEAGKQSRNHEAPFLARQRYRRRWLAAGERRR